MAADFNKPTISGDPYVDILPEIRAQMEVVSTMSYGNALNKKTNAVQFLDGRFQRWDGSAFQNVPISITGGGTGASTAEGARAALSVPSVADVSSGYLSKAGNLVGLTNYAIARDYMDVYGKSEVYTKDESDTRTLDLIESEAIYSNSETIVAPSNDLTSGSCTVARVGNLVVISGSFSHSSSAFPGSLNGFIPEWARPSTLCSNNYVLGTNYSKRVVVSSLGGFAFYYRSFDEGGSAHLDTTTDGFTISYTV